MEERLYRAQMEVSLFSKAIANAYEELNVQYHPRKSCSHDMFFDTDFRALATWQRAIIRENPVAHVEMPLSIHDDDMSDNFDRCQPSKATREKCETWLSTSWQFQTNFPRTQEVPQFHQYVSKVSIVLLRRTRFIDAVQTSDDTFLLLPCLLKAWVSNAAYGDFISASCADTKPFNLDQPDSFRTKDDKPLDVIKSDFHILQLMKRRAQSEVDMFSEAISRTAGIRCTDDGEYAVFTFVVLLM